MNSVKGNIFRYSIAVMSSKAIGMATTFCIAKLLLPEEYGIWMSLSIIVGLSAIASLGTVEALAKQIPFYLGAQNFDLIKKTDGTVLFSIILSACFIVFINLLLVIAKLILKNATMLGYVQIVLITASIALFTTYYYYRLMAYSKFKEVSFLNSFRSIITFIIIIPLCVFWRLPGMFIGALLAEISILIVSIKINSCVKTRICIVASTEYCASLIKIGFPITVIWWVYMIMTFIGRIITLELIGKAAAGYYSFGTSIVSIVAIIPMAIGQVLYPQINDHLGKKAKNKLIEKYVTFPAQIMSLIIPLMLGLGLCITPFVIKTFFKKYVTGISAIQILICGGYFVCLIKNGCNYLVSINKHRELLKYVIICLVATVLLMFCTIWLGYEIAGVAISTAIGNIMLTTMVYKAVYKNMQYSLYEQIRKVYQLYSPLIIVISIMLLSMEINSLFKGICINEMIEVAIRCSIFLTTYVAVLLVVPYYNSISRILVSEIKR